MRKFIITTAILLVAVTAITVMYFKNLNTPAAHTSKVMQNIPNTAALVFEFSNDDGFYDIFSNSNLLTALAGKQKINELAVLHEKLLQAPLLKNYFKGQHIYLSMHGMPADTVDFLITLAGNELSNTDHLKQLGRQPGTGLVINNFKLGGKEAFSIDINELKKRFYVVNKGNHIFAGSFNKNLALASAQYQPVKNADNFLQIPDQQSATSLANLYVNYEQLTPLFDQFFEVKNTGILKSLRMLPALGALTLNYKTDALMFNGFTNFEKGKPLSYLALFRNQRQVESHIRNVFPSTTAISSSFALSDVKRFKNDLEKFHSNAGLTKERTALYNLIKSETGVTINNDFSNQLTGEFAILTTRYDEKYAIIAIKDGAAMRPLMINISTMATDDIGQFKYNKLPYFLLGDSFSVLNHPYFMILDNYLVLANSISELTSYKDTYTNHKFLDKTAGYPEFDNLLAERFNAAFFIHFKNVYPLLKRDMKPSFVSFLNPDNQSIAKFYGFSWQFSASDGNFFTNFSMRLSGDVTSFSNN